MAGELAEKIADNLCGRSSFDDGMSRRRRILRPVALKLQPGGGQQ